MEAAGLSGKRTAQMLGWSESRLSRFLSGKLDATEIEVSALLALYGVIGDERDRLLRLAREQRICCWRDGEQLRTLADHQSKAERITDFHATTIPALLQTERYARSLIVRTANTSQEDGPVLLAGRMARQRVLGRTVPPQCVFVIPELALHLPVGGRQVMSGQLHHLLRLAVRPHITIVVIPARVGAHAGLAGSCCLLEANHLDPVAYLERENGGQFLEQVSDVAAYQNVFTALAAVALGQQETIELIGRLAVTLYGPERVAASVS